MFGFIIGFILVGMIIWTICAIIEAKNTPKLKKHQKQDNSDYYWK